MAQLLSMFSGKLDWDNGTETPGHVNMSHTGGEWLVGKQVVFIQTVLVAFCGLVGNGVVCWLLCSQVRSSPYMTYILNLDAVDMVNQSCVTVILLEKIHVLYHQVTLQLAVFLEPVSYFSDTVGLCLLVAISIERFLCVLCPTWYWCCHRPKHTSAMMSILSWALDLSLHVVSQVCEYWEKGLACDQFQAGFIIFHMLICLVMGISSLTLTIRSLSYLKKCSPIRIYHIVRFVAISFLVWGLPLVVLVHLPGEEYLAFAFDLLLLLSMVVSMAQTAMYFLAGCLRRKRHRESLKVVLPRALLNEMEGGGNKGSQAREQQVTRTELLPLQEAVP
uniref:Mas-related G protein-coupled receptor H n=1 Tax=Pongo abelii TaxID=9601 RepID=W8W3E3_PONAB|nr:TPA: Mas-related G protein-coupled receptor H [Pongo abelii]